MAELCSSTVSQPKRVAFKGARIVGLISKGDLPGDSSSFILYYLIMASDPLVIFGAGGHGISVADIAVSNGIEVHCFVDPLKGGTTVLGIPVISGLLELRDDIASYRFAIAIGDNNQRNELYVQLKQKNMQLRFPPLFHCSASISPFSAVEEGSVVAARARLGPNSSVGKFCIINSGTAIDHGCRMLDFSSTGPGVTLGGNVSIGLRSAVCIGAVVKHSCMIGDDSILGANSYLNICVGAREICFGSPAKFVRRRLKGESYLH
jgi:sugar O-acyltransferase (sialic acid O-acetyltransferase NeuD family)